MAVQKKQSVIPSSQGPLSSRSIDSKRKGNGSERDGDNIKPNSQAKKSACSVNMSAQICNTATPRATAVANGPNVDERLRAARERREEQQKLLASRELSRVQREQRARRYYEQQLQQRKKKLQEQRLKEEKRRAAVEEKRKQRLKEEKERYESAVRRTLEKSQRVQQNPGQNPRGRKLTKNVSYHSVNTTTTTTAAISTTYKPHYHSGSVHNRPSASAGLNKSEHRSSSLAQTKSARQQDANKKKSNDGSNTRSPVKPAAVTQSRTASPSPERTPRRPISRHSTPLQIELPSVPEEDVAVCSPALSPGNSRPVRTAEGQEEKTRDENPPETRCSDVPHKKTEAITRTAGDGSPPQTPPRSAPQPPEVMFRPSAGTTDPEEASRLLAERRREARLQREREEKERLQREEAERLSREELERRRAEERARQQAEAQRLIEEKKRREDEEQRRAEEERAQAMKEAALLQKQRLEEIMRRTRRTDSPDTKSVPLRTSSNEPRPKENTEPLHNGTIQDAIKLPVATKTSQLGLSNEEDMVPVVAFKERRSLRTLTGLEEIQSHQRAGHLSACKAGRRSKIGGGEQRFVCETRKAAAARLIRCPVGTFLKEHVKITALPLTEDVSILVTFLCVTSGTNIG
ncbi:Ensconsin Epithelial microtubule-associated protein of 115 kDa [Collichthys lucidus]|uniref:Ensconsin Epithelial microtubule-associated protein of 115 kDa n=1 Tax=Collichthys lucidus TaxID=240159 RepID=A0A4U5VH07_COLLU|nr:Ensconsin Epithelial microtubule-associated protein of 115 kDa [Collichthys lucidus]